MKIEIDLENIFRDEEGFPDESLEESIRRQVVSRLTEDYRKRLFQRFDQELGNIMREQIAQVMAEQMPDFVDDILNAEYRPIGRYGDRGEKTTFRAEIIKSVTEEMQYKPQDYSHKENAFTKAVKSIVELKTNEVKEHLTKEIDTKFKTDAITYAVRQLSERLGLAKK